MQKSKAILEFAGELWPFPIHNGERTASSKSIMTICKPRNSDKNEGIIYYDLDSVLYYKHPVDTNAVVASKATNNEEKEAPF